MSWQLQILSKLYGLLAFFKYRHETIGVTEYATVCLGEKSRCKQSFKDRLCSTDLATLFYPTLLLLRPGYTARIYLILFSPLPLLLLIWLRLLEDSG